MVVVGGSQSCDVFVDNLVKCVQFACVRRCEKDTSFGGQFPQRPGAHLLCSGKAPDASSNEEKRMDLGIDYRRQSVLPQCFMKSIHQYQSGDGVRPKPK